MKPDPQGLPREQPEVNHPEDGFNEEFLDGASGCTAARGCAVKDMSLLGSSLNFFVGFFFQCCKK